LPRGAAGTAPQGGRLTASQSAAASAASSFCRFHRRLRIPRRHQSNLVPKHVNAMHLEDVLRQIQTDRANLRHGRAVHPIRVRLWRGAWRPVMFVERDLDIIARYATRVLAFAEGTIIAQGAPAAVIGDAPVKRYILGEAPPLRRALAAPP
jgi:hypothetical protein